MQVKACAAFAWMSKKLEGMMRQKLMASTNFDFNNLSYRMTKTERKTRELIFYSLRFI